MADFTKDIWNDSDGEEQKPPRKKRGRRVLIPGLILVGVLAVVLAAAYRDGTGFDVLRRNLSQGVGEAASGDTIYEYDVSAGNSFALLGDRLVVLSDTGAGLLDRQGEEIWAVSASFSAPALVQKGERAVLYDVGGTELYLLDRQGELLHLKAEEDEPLIAANLNENGWLTVTAEKQNYKGCVSVYDEEQEQVFAFNSSERYVLDACVTDDDRILAAVTLGQEEGVFVSNIVLYDMKATAPEAEQDATGGLSAAPPVADYDVADALVVAIGQQGERIVTISDTRLTLAETDGTITADYPYQGAYLRAYDMGGDGFTALLLNRYQSGSVGRLVTLDTEGAEIASLDVSREVLDVSAAGRYLAVLYTDSLVIYNESLEKYASLQGTDFASGVLMCEDGAAVLLSSDHAELFLS